MGEVTLNIHANIAELKASLDQANQKVDQLEKNVKETGSTIKVAGQQGAAGINEMNQQTTKGERIFANLKGSIIASIAAFVSFNAIMKVGKALIESTDKSSDAWAKNLSGIRAGLSYVAKSLSSLNLTGFTKNLEDAIRAGRQYEEVLDNLGDLYRSLGIQEEEARVRTLKLIKELRNVNLSQDERIVKAKEIIKIEDELSQKRIKDAKKDLDNELFIAGVLNQINEEKLYDLIKNFDAYEKQIDAAESLIEAEDNLAAAQKLQFQQTTKQGWGYFQAQIEDYQKSIKGADKDVKDFTETYRAFLNVSDPEKTKIAEKGKAYFSALASFDEATLRTETRMNGLLLMEDKAADKKVKSLTAYEKLKEEIGKLEAKLIDEVIANDKNAASTGKLVYEKKALLTAYEEIAGAMATVLQKFEMKDVGQIESQIEPAIMTFRDTFTKKWDELINEPFRRGDETFNVWENIFGVDDPKQKAQLDEFVGQTITAIQQILAARIEASQAVLQMVEQQISEQEQAVNREQELMVQGYANNLSLEKKKLSDLKKQRDIARVEQQKAVQAQLNMEGLLQAASLTTAGAELFKGGAKFGLPGILFAIAAIATMFAYFSKIKATAAGLTKYAGGGQLKGRSHAQGGIYVPELGAELEGSEYVVNKKSTQKYKPLLDAINADTLALNVSVNRDLIKDIEKRERYMSSVSARVSLDDSKQLAQIKELLEKMTGNQVSYGKGFRIERRGNNVKKIYD